MHSWHQMISDIVAIYSMLCVCMCVCIRASIWANFVWKTSVKIKTRKINKKSRFMLIAFALFAIFVFKPFESTAFLYTSLSAYAASIWCPKMHTKKYFCFIYIWEMRKGMRGRSLNGYYKISKKKVSREFFRSIVCWILRRKIISIDDLCMWLFYAEFACD